MASTFLSRRSTTSPALHFREGPRNGPALLLLHGVARDASDWEGLLPTLKRDWQVIALDQRGHGRSEWAQGEYRVIDYARDAAAFIREHCASPVTVLGHSLGAMVALWLAAECDAQIARVVLEDPPFHTMGRRIVSTPYRHQFAAMRDLACQRWEDLEALTEALSNVELPSVAGTVRLGDLRDRDSLRYSAECLRRVDPDVFSPLVAGVWLDAFDHEALWARVKCPVLLLQGDPAMGGACSDADVALARERTGHCRHQRFDGVGHQIHGTRPQEVLAALKRFVRQ